MPFEKFSLSKIEDIYIKARECHVVPGAYRLQNLLGERHFSALMAPSILVGGTNGKGSTCAYLESVFRYAGFKTGLYTSPHLCAPNERIRIENKPVSEKAILKVLTELCQNNLALKPSFFELMTAAAFLIFSQKKVNIIICEVGLGGRFDSTNSLSPNISVLTGVGLDHTHILGKTVKKIASDKSYIARRNRPMIMNSLAMSSQAYKAAHQVVKSLGAIPLNVSDPLSKSYEEVLSWYSHVPYASNLRTVLHVLSVFIQQNYLEKNPFSQHVLTDAIENTHWPGRFDKRIVSGKEIIFDCAHNPQAIQAFLKAYDCSEFAHRQFHLVFASFEDKNWKKNIELLALRAKTITVTEILHERSEKALCLYRYIQGKRLHSKVCCSENLQDALVQTLDSSQLEPVVVIGSIAFIGSAFESLKLNVFKT